MDLMDEEGDPSWSVDETVVLEYSGICTYEGPKITFLIHSFEGICPLSVVVYKPIIEMLPGAVCVESPVQLITHKARELAKLLYCRFFIV